MKLLASIDNSRKASERVAKVTVEMEERKLMEQKIVMK